MDSIWTLNRAHKMPGRTVGVLIFDKHTFFTIEDEDRGLTIEHSLEYIKRKKVKHLTAIPLGLYSVVINYSPRFKKKLPRLLDVKGFDGILIHSGNTEKDSSGCIIVGRKVNSTFTQVHESRLALEEIMTLMEAQLSIGNVFINIV